MKMRIENIGIISTAELSLRGITVVAGNNGTGKSTLGKVWYSVIDGICNLYDKQKKDIALYAKNVLSKARMQFTYRYAFWSLNHMIKDEVIRNFFGKDDSKIQQMASDSKEIEKLRNHLSEMDVSQNEYADLLKEYYKGGKNGFFEEIVEEHQIEISHAIEIINDLLDVYNGDKNGFYARRYVEKNLQTEFYGQIESIHHEGNSLINLCSEFNSTEMNITIRDEKILEQGLSGVAIEYDRVYYIDDPFVMNVIKPNKDEVNVDYEDDNIWNNEDIEMHIQHYNHSEVLTRELSSSELLSEYEMIQNQCKYREIMECLYEVMPGTIVSKNGRYYFDDKNSIIRLENLATGCKVFSILKMLIEKGKITEKTLLIFDEPEAHLHPQWQSLLAKMIVLMNIEIGCHFLIATHSSQFLLSIDAYSKENNIESKCRFYQTALNEGTHQATINDVSDKLDCIYGDFVQYLSEMKAKRDLYANV